MQRFVINQHVIHAGGFHIVFNTECGRGITLRVVIDNQHIHSSLSERCRQIHGGTGFTYAALLV